MTLEHDSMPTSGIEQEVRQLIKTDGIGALPVDDLTVDDLDTMAWSGGPGHIKSVEAALQRVGTGEVEYLAVRTPDGTPISKGGIDYKYRDSAGYMWQLATMPELRRLGIGTHLVQAMEERIRRRGLSTAMLGVEDDNPGAKKLYERLGYKTIGPLEDSWEEEDTLGNKSVHHATGDLLAKTV